MKYPSLVPRAREALQRSSEVRIIKRFDAAPRCKGCWGLAQQVGHGQLDDAGLSAAGGPFQVGDGFEPAARFAPADAQARRDRLAERPAQHHVAGFVEGLDRRAPIVLFGQVVVDHVLDQRAVALGDHLRQPASVIARHARAQRVGQRRHDEQGLDRLGLEGELQGVQRDAAARMGRDLERPQMEFLEDLEHPEVGR